MTSGIFLRIVAETAEEDLRSGKRDIAPYWRVLKSDGSLNEKYPGGIDHQAGCLREEGFQIEAGTGRKPPKVKDYQARLARL